jgi:hypothetical protein
MNDTEVEWLSWWMEGCIDAKMCGWMKGPKELRREVTCKFCDMDHFVRENNDC